MTETKPRLYNDLAWIWPLWGSPDDEYHDWCDHIGILMQQFTRRPLRTILDMGCGGGKNVFNLKRSFEVTGIDISESMLQLARRLNPDCRFHLADMRTMNLECRFDAILIDDAIAYMTTLDELSSVFQTANRHLQPGGVMIVSPDVTRESFIQNRTETWCSSKPELPDQAEIVFIENSYDPDPSDRVFEATFVYLIREQGRLRIETDRHTLGLFNREDWREVLRRIGFDLHEEIYAGHPSNEPVFVCVKPTE